MFVAFSYCLNFTMTLKEGLKNGDSTEIVSLE